MSLPEENKKPIRVVSGGVQTPYATTDRLWFKKSWQAIPAYGIEQYSFSHARTSIIVKSTPPGANSLPTVIA